jgi:hypothetical protein
MRRTHRLRAAGAGYRHPMEPSWDESLAAFTDAAGWFVAMVGRIDGGWDRPGLGEWDLRALVGHTSRSLLTVEAYVDRPAPAVDVASAVDYFRTTSALASGPAVAQRGRDAGDALGPDPAAAVAEIADRVLRLLGDHDGSALVTTIAGGMRLGAYLPTRTFELAVHTCDLAVALDEPLDVPPAAGAQALGIVAELALTGGGAGRLLLAATGRPSPAGLSVL